MPYATQCIRPDDYRNTNLFVERPEADDVKRFLTAFLDQPQGQHRLLVTGERGVGKSIGVRATIARLEIERRDFFPLIIAGDRCTTLRHLLITIAENFSQEVRRLFPDDKDLIRLASHLPDMVQPDMVTRGDFYTRGCEIEANIETDYGILTFFKLKLGLRGALSDQRGIERTVTIPIDNDFRIQLLGRVLHQVAISKPRRPLLFIDNLDQITEKERIEEFLCYMLRLEDIPIVVTVRSEYVSTDILREHRHPLRFKSLASEKLMSILEHRLETDCPDADMLRETGLLSIAEELSERTGNPLAFLYWLEHLCWKTDLNPTNYMDELRTNYIRDYFEAVEEELRQVAEHFSNARVKYTSRDILLQELGLSNDDLNYLENQGVLTPREWGRSRENRRYTLSPLLEFLKSRD